MLKSCSTWPSSSPLFCTVNLEFGVTHQYVSAKDVKDVSSPSHLSVQETYLWDGENDFESKKVQLKLLFPQWVPWLWSSYRKDRFCQIFLALDVDEDKGSTQLLAPWGRVGKLTRAPQFSAVRTWKQERDTLSHPQMSQLPWEDVLAWPVPSNQLVSLLTRLLSFSFFLSCPLSDICYYIIAHQWECHKMPFSVSSLLVKALFLQQILLICSSLMLGRPRWGAAPFHYATMLLHSNNSSPATFTAQSRQHSLLWKTSLSFRPSQEVTGPGHQRDRALLVSLPCVGTSDISDSLDSLLFLCCVAWGFPQLQWKVSCQGSQPPAHTAHGGEVPNAVPSSSFRRWVPKG